MGDTLNSRVPSAHTLHYHPLAVDTDHGQSTELPPPVSRPETKQAVTLPSQSRLGPSAALLSLATGRSERPEPAGPAVVPCRTWRSPHLTREAAAPPRPQVRLRPRLAKPPRTRRRGRLRVQASGR